MKRRKWLAALWAALLLLTGCAPGPATEAEAPPPATSAPVGTQTLAGVDFSAFLEEANAARRAVLEDGPDLDLSPWTADFRDQNDTFTPEEMDRLTAPPEALPPLSRAGMEEDVETLFTLLRTTYGAYTYFGGDEVFLPLKDAVRSDLEGSATCSPGTWRRCWSGISLRCWWTGTLPWVPPPCGTATPSTCTTCPASIFPTRRGWTRPTSSPPSARTGPSCTGSPP